MEEVGAAVRSGDHGDGAALLLWGVGGGVGAGRQGGGGAHRGRIAQGVGERVATLRQMD